MDLALDNLQSLICHKPKQPAMHPLTQNSASSLIIMIIIIIIIIF